jgi:hypothetical protein
MGKKTNSETIDLTENMKENKVVDKEITAEEKENNKKRIKAVLKICKKFDKIIEEAKEIKFFNEDDMLTLITSMIIDERTADLGIKALTIFGFIDDSIIYNTIQIAAMLIRFNKHNKKNKQHFDPMMMMMMGGGGNIDPMMFYMMSQNKNNSTNMLPFLMMCSNDIGGTESPFNLSEQFEKIKSRVDFYNKMKSSKDKKDSSVEE